MNQTKLARWIEQAEERSVCELAKTDLGLFKLSAMPSAMHRTLTEMVKTILGPAKPLSRSDRTDATGGLRPACPNWFSDPYRRQFSCTSIWS